MEMQDRRLLILWKTINKMQGGKDMKVDIWLDFVCPFCYMGDKQFKEALNQFESLKDIEINYRSFELDPSKNRDKTISAVEDLANKYQMPIEKAKHIMEKTVKRVQDAGLAYRYKEMVPANTFDAHRLTYYAKESGKDQAVVEKILKAHFVYGLDIGDQGVLANLASEAGLNKEETIAMLNSHKYASNLAHDEKVARELKVDVVPTLIFHNGERIAGVLSPEDYVEALKKVKS